MRTVSFDVPPQEVLSRDSVTVSVDAVVYYRVSNPTMATNNIEDYRYAYIIKKTYMIWSMAISIQDFN